MKKATLWLLAVATLSLGPGEATAAANRPAQPTAEEKKAQEKFAAEHLLYRGYTVNIVELQGEPQKPAIMASIRQQIDIIESARIRQQELDFFRSLPILFKDSLRKSHARWNERLGRLELLPKPLERGPILLHEMLHAYHIRKLPQGHENPDVRGFYQAARKAAQQNGAPLADEHDEHYYLKNEREYFAVTATVYLVGTIDKAPNTRQAIQQQYPEYYKFLATLFGPRDPVDPPRAAPAAPRRPARS